ncbi:MAG: GCN5-related N-acetyltransferase [Labilithrix sp.]|nr:GCN5-related N-acetyltransferase [Labilithrix sp.]
MIIATERLVLRDFDPHDWEGMLAIEGDPEAVRYQSFQARSEVDCRVYIARDIASRSPQRWCFDLAVTLADTGRLVGRVGLDVKAPERQLGELWFILERASWGKGLMTEAARAVVDFGFHERKLRRIFLECDPRNLAATRVAEKIGMKREGLLREQIFLKGEWVDSLYYGILSREWPT